MWKRSRDSFSTLRPFSDEGEVFFSLPALSEKVSGIERLPCALKILLENMLRFEDGTSVKSAAIENFSRWQKHQRVEGEIAFRPSRVLMQDFTGLPALVDLAAMRDVMEELGGDSQKITPQIPVDLVIDHSVVVDHFAVRGAFALNVKREFERNRERYAFLRWGQKAFSNLRVVPPGTGICHQVNLEYLAQTVRSDSSAGTERCVYPDTLVGTDSHTTMVNALGVLGWGVGGIEAEAAMLGQPVSLRVPEVVGFRLEGALRAGTTATDLVLRIVEILRAKGVVGKFVEFFGKGLDSLSLADRATIANMAPEYGATCGLFPIDVETLRYYELTGRSPALVERVRNYAKMQGLWRDDAAPPLFLDEVTLDLASVGPAIAGPKRPQDRVPLSQGASSFSRALQEQFGKEEALGAVPPHGEVAHGSVVIAAITSCTNTSNPSLILAAGMLAKQAVLRGMKVKPWVKTSFAPGSQVVTDYLIRANLQPALDTLGFTLVGYGCTTCIGNSGPLIPFVTRAVQDKDLVVCSVLSGNRNFEGRINPLVRANYLASPPLVVAYALAGSMRVDITTQPLGNDKLGKPVFLKDLWPSEQEIQHEMQQSIRPEMFKTRYANVFEGKAAWRELPVSSLGRYKWSESSSYVRKPPFFESLKSAKGKASARQDIRSARVLALLGDSITTDHISPAGAFAADSSAGAYLQEQGVAKADFNSYGARRGNHEVMIRGTFGNIRIKNALVAGREGAWSRHFPSGEIMRIFDTARRYQDEGVALVVVAGKEYGTGSSRDWAAKGTRLLGVRAVLVESFERIHRSNLIGMGVLPLQFRAPDNAQTLGLTGEEKFDIYGLGNLKPQSRVSCLVHYADGSQKSIDVDLRIDTEEEMEYYKSDGILCFVLTNLLQEDSSQHVA